MGLVVLILGAGCFDTGPLDPTDPDTVIALFVTPASGWIREGGSLQLEVRGLTVSGREVLAQGARFESDNPALASVASNGMLTGVRSGEVTITVTGFGLQTRARITVQPGTAVASGWHLTSASISHATLLGVWTGDTRSMAVGSEGTVLERQGEGWEGMETPTEELLTGVWGASDDDVWAVGAGGTILHFDGFAWTRFPSPVEAPLLGVWGLASDQVWAVGVNVILRFDGVRWTDMALPTGPHEIWSIWGDNPSNLFAVGQNGRILHFDGQRWAIQPSPTTGVLFGIHGVTANEIYAVGLGGMILRFSDGQWRAEQSPTPATLFGVDGRGPGTLTAVGNRGVVIRRTGGTWTLVPGPPSADNLRAVAVEGEDRFRAVGWSATILSRTPGNWDPELVGDDLFAVVGTAEGSWWAAGVAGTMLRMNGGEWVRTAVPSPHTIFGLAGGSDQELLAVGDSGTVLHYDGNSWAPVALEVPGMASITLWRSVWLAVSGEAVVVGEGGRILHRNAVGDWSAAPSPTSRFLRHTFGLAPSSVFAVGDGGTILQYDGSTWRPMVTPVRNTIRGIWGTAPNDLLAVGDGGVLLRYDGERWYALPSPVTVDIRAVWGSSPTDAYAAGEDGVVLHYDGSGWSELLRRPGIFWLGLTGRGRDVLAVGEGLHILQALRP